MSAVAALTTSGRVLVAVDGSEPSKLALRWGAFVAASLGVPMEAMICWHWAAVGYAPYPSDWNPATDARTVLDQTIASVFGTQDLPADLKLTVREGYAPERVLAESADAAMLVVGSRGHGGFAGLLLGSVSSACSEHATCPVLVVHGATPEPPA